MPSSEKLICLICGKPSLQLVCTLCADRLRREALHNEIVDIRLGRMHCHS